MIFEKNSGALPIVAKRLPFAKESPFAKRCSKNASWLAHPSTGSG